MKLNCLKIKFPLFVATRIGKLIITKSIGSNDYDGNFLKNFLYSSLGY